MRLYENLTLEEIAFVTRKCSGSIMKVTDLYLTEEQIEYIICMRPFGLDVRVTEGYKDYNPINQINHLMFWCKNIDFNDAHINYITTDAEVSLRVVRLFQKALKEYVTKTMPESNI